MGSRFAELAGAALIAALAASATARADAVRVDCAQDGNIQRKQRQKDQAGFEADGLAFAALGVFPDLELPDANREVRGVRFNLVAGEHVDVYGIDVGVIGNIVRREVAGLQCAAVFNHAGESRSAVQFAAVNICDGSFAGLQAGAFNFAEKAAGIQIGVVNRANIMRGVQIGLANFIASSPVPFFPVVNCAF